VSRGWLEKEKEKEKEEKARTEDTEGTEEENEKWVFAGRSPCRNTSVEGPLRSARVK
jgi:hypothetical protein